MNVSSCPRNLKRIYMLNYSQTTPSPSPTFRGSGQSYLSEYSYSVLRSPEKVKSF